MIWRLKLIAVLLLALLLVWLGHDHVTRQQQQTERALTATTPHAGAPVASVIEPPQAIEQITPEVHYEPALRELPPELRQLASYLKAGLLLEQSAGELLWARHEDEPLPIASMTKMMTVLVALDLIESKPSLALTQTFEISRAAAEVGGSQVWLAAGEHFTLEQLCEAMMVRSANDAAYAVAEAVSGGQPALFVAMMNRHARQLGLYRARFYNVHGLPEADAGHDNVATATEVAALAAAVLADPNGRRWCATREAVFRPGDKQVIMRSRNRLLAACDGVDGVKTGYIRRAGFCVAASCLRQNRRLIAVAIGAPDKDTRDRFVAGLFDWAYAQLATAPAAVIVQPAP